MIGEDPPANGILRRGVLYRFRGTRHSRPEPSPEVLEVVRRAEQKMIREYFEQKKRRAS